MSIYCVNHIVKAIHCIMSSSLKSRLNGLNLPCQVLSGRSLIHVLKNKHPKNISQLFFFFSSGITIILLFTFSLFFWLLPYNVSEPRMARKGFVFFVCFMVAGCHFCLFYLLFQESVHILLL